MTNPYRAMCAELVAEIEKWQQADDEFSDAGTIRADANYDLAPRARALLAQPEPKGPKPVVDYSRVPEIATEAQIRSAAQYLVKKRNCDGDLISAIEYAIARWGRPTLQPVAEGPTAEELLAMRSWSCHGPTFDSDLVDFASAVLAKWGTLTPQPVAVSERLPGPEDCDEQGRCWVFDDQLGLPSWTLIKVQGESLDSDMHWLPANALPAPEAKP
jgi:hypothetical protein